MGFLRLAALAALFGGLVIGQVRHIHTAGAQSDAPTSHRGCLSFHLVHPQVQAYSALQDGAPAGFRINLIQGSDAREAGLVISETPVVTGSELADAEVSIDPGTQQPAILLRFDAQGTRELARFTQENMGRALAIVLDGRVVSAPVIREPILGGHAQISGTLTKVEAEEIAARLRAKDCRGN
jgi:preprotein translocase subunit SecD